MLHIENGKIFVELEINKKENLDLSPMTEDQINNLMRIYRGSMIDALENRMKKCEEQLLLAISNKTPMKQTEWGIFWKRGRFSFRAYESMQLTIEALKEERFIDVLEEPNSACQLIQALMDDEQGIDNHTLIGLLVEYAIIPQDPF